MANRLLICSILLFVTSSAVAQNSPPIGVPDLYHVEKNGNLTVPDASGVLANDLDLDGDAFFIANGILPDHGTLAFNGSGGGFTYTPDTDFVGADTFGYRISDSIANSELTDVIVMVLPSPNRKPVAVTDGYTTPFETQLVIAGGDGLLKNDFDPDGDQLFVGAFTSPPNGSVSVNISTGAFTYTPDAGFAGPDTFQYRIRDPDFAISSLVDVVIEVQPGTNRTPTAFSNFYFTPVDSQLSVPAAAGLLFNDYDPDGDQIFVGAFTSPPNGSVSMNISTGALTYTPNSGFTGKDKFQYRIRDPDFAISALVDVFVGVGVDPTLPVELVSFEALRDDDVVRLTWHTASEENNAGFEIERSVDGREFQKIGFVRGNGSSNERQWYEFTDPDLPFEAAGLTYRLKQIDFDGVFEYSSLVELDLSLPDSYALHENFPNPFRGTTTIRYELPTDSSVRLAVYDQQGRRVAGLVDERQAAGRHAIPFDASDLASGVYFYRLETDNGRNQSGRMLNLSQ